MTLTPEQKQTVSTWIAAGDNLSAVQKKLAEQFKLPLTYMDVRFLVDDLGLELKNAAPKADASDVTKAPVAKRPATAKRPPAGNAASAVDGDDPLAADSADDPPLDDSALPPDELDEAAGEELPGEPGGVTLELDRIVRPGTAVSGTVTFSDGISGKWALDQHGRLMLETAQKGYQPSAPDVQAFQRELQAQLQKQGY